MGHLRTQGLRFLAISAIALVVIGLTTVLLNVGSTVQAQPTDALPLATLSAPINLGWSLLGIIGAGLGLLIHWIWRVRRQLAQLRRQLSDRQTNALQLQVQLQQANQVRTELETQAEQTQALLDHLQTELQAERQLAQQQQQQATGLTEQLQTLKLRLQEGQNEQDYTQLLEDENQALQQRYQALEQQVQTQQTQLSQQQVTVANLQTRLSQADRQFKDVSYQLDVCRDQSRTHKHIEKGQVGLGSAAVRGKVEQCYRLQLLCVKDLEKLRPKDFRQLINRILELQIEPRPHDHRPLIKYGLRDVLSVDAGEYRICYRLHQLELADPSVSQGEIEILMVDKRNDDTIYRRLQRSLKGG